MLTLVYLLFNGYPSDKIVIPITIALSIVGIKMALANIKEEFANEKNY